jgi:hypothetical protein
MTAQKLYTRAIIILDDEFEQTTNLLNLEITMLTWREKMIYAQLKQSSHILFALLSNSEESKFQNSRYVSDIILFGTLGRIIRDIYVNIIYLKTSKHSIELMESCWNYQIAKQKLIALSFENIDRNQEAINKIEQEEQNLKSILIDVSFETKPQVLQGKSEKLLNLEELAEVKGFNKKRFHNEFVFFSQFAHSTAFANSFITEKGTYSGLIAAIYDRVVAYYTGIFVETMEIFNPTQEKIDDLKRIYYDEIIGKRWNNKPACA